MALDTEKKLYIAVGVLAVLGGGLYLQSQKEKEEAAAHTLSGAAKDLPKIALTEDQTKGIDRIEIRSPGDEDGGTTPEDFVLVKKGEDDWQLEKPVAYKANASNVKSLATNLTKLKVTELISESKDSYEKYGLDDKKALHAVFKKGDEVLADLYFGDSGGRGQMTRVAGKDGVYAVKGYSKYLYGRDLKGWRDLTIFKFDDKEAVSVEIENDKGKFKFEKDGDSWSHKFKKVKSPVATKIDRFDDAKVGDLLRAYKALNAAAFGDGKSLTDTGLEEPSATVTIKLKEDKATYLLQVGSVAEGSNRWVKKNGSDTIFSVSSWAADWATADVDKFQKADEKADGGS